MPAPQRILSLVPSLTETLHTLGLERQVVGVTRFCVHPPHWRREKATVGGTKNVRIERARSLRPDLVLANREENTRADVEALSGFAPVHVSHIQTLEDALACIAEIGGLTGAPEAAGALAEGIRGQFARLPAPAPLRAAYLIWRRPYMAAGGDTFIDQMLAAAGFANVFGAARRYPATTAEEIAALQPDCVLCATEPFPFAAAHLAELHAALPGVRVARVDGERFSWYGSRLLGAPAYFNALRGALASGAEPLVDLADLPCPALPL